jgi:hypothetical protein
VRRLQELNPAAANRFKDLTNGSSGGNLGDLPPPDYATVVIEADRRRRDLEYEDDDDIYLEPRDALNNFQLRDALNNFQQRDALNNFQLRQTTSSLVTTEIGSFSVDLGTLNS